jgi:hypothetical protein
LYDIFVYFAISFSDFIIHFTPVFNYSNTQVKDSVRIVRGRGAGIDVQDPLRVGVTPRGLNMLPRWPR